MCGMDSTFGMRCRMRCVELKMECVVEWEAECIVMKYGMCSAMEDIMFDRIED